MVERDHSFETIGEAERLAPADDGGEQVYDDDDDDDEEEETDGGDGGGVNCGEEEVNGEQRRQLSELHSSPLIEAELDGSQSRTLPVVSSSLQLREFTASSHLLSEVPVNYAILRPLEPADFKAQIGVSHHNALAGEKTLAAVDQSQKLLSPGHPTSSSELSPVSLLHSVPLASTPDTTKTLSVASVAKTPSIDGYNWRKYGQKQVKSPQGSRSYYRCTYSDCSAKKIECCDHSNHVVEIISKGLHNHDPPRRTNYSRGSRLASSAAPDSTSHSVRLPNDIDSSTSPKGFVQEFPALPETKRESSSGSDGTAEIEFKEEHVDEPEPKQRMKKSKSAYSESLSKPSKKPKFVVHAAGDVGISGDGYRWRKYGQKMVKGNPHPRNYYRCTSAGCPVRKHVERAVDNTSAVIITYKGVHDHDMPVPKKRHGPPSGALVAAAAPSSMNNLPIRKTETIQNQFSATQWSVDRDGELTSETLDVAEDKAMESARTLLSIGFEIKQC